MLKTVSTQLALASDTLSEILANGNTSGPNNIIMDAGYGINGTLGATTPATVAATTGTFSGAVTAGGISTSKNVVDQFAAEFVNTAATSYGLYVKGGSTGQVALRVDSAAGSVLLSMAGDTGATTFAGNLVMASGNGIDFSATAGTGTSELLDDYEEGVWTPTYSASGLSGITYLSQQGTYTKIGRAVYVVFYIATSGTFTSGSSALTVSGLPFTSASTNTSHVGFSQATRFTTAPVSGKISDNTTSINIYSAYNGTGPAADPVSITGSGMISTDGGNNNAIQASAMYFV